MSSLRRGHANLLCIVPIFAWWPQLRGSIIKAPKKFICDQSWTHFSVMVMTENMYKKGAVRELNPRPLAPKARIIPLDQRPIALLQNMLDGIRTRNPQIRSLMRYPLRHEHMCKHGMGTCLAARIAFHLWTCFSITKNVCLIHFWDNWKFYVLSFHVKKGNIKFSRTILFCGKKQSCSDELPTAENSRPIFHGYQTFGY